MAQQGLEQLLWHTAAIEACVGEETGGLTKLLSERVSRIIRPNANEADRVRKDFKALYEFRSNLVHGKRELHSDKAKDRLNLEHLRKACDFARRVVLWTLFHLKHLSQTTGSSIPKRDKILETIDTEWERQAFKAGGLKHLAPDLP